MADVEYVPVLDENGNDVGGYTETVPDTYVKEEPDCYTCCDRGCPDCAPRVDVDSLPFTFTGRWPETNFSNEPPF